MMIDMRATQHSFLNYNSSARLMAPWEIKLPVYISYFIFATNNFMFTISIKLLLLFWVFSISSLWASSASSIHRRPLGELQWCWWWWWWWWWWSSSKESAKRRPQSGPRWKDEHPQIQIRKYNHTNTNTDTNTNTQWRWRSPDRFGN